MALVLPLRPFERLEMIDHVEGGLSCTTNRYLYSLGANVSSRVERNWRRGCLEYSRLTLPIFPVTPGLEDE